MFHCGSDRGRHANRTRLADSFYTERISPGRSLEHQHVNIANVGAQRQKIILERRSQHLAIFIVGDSLKESVANAVRHAAVELSLHDS